MSGLQNVDTMVDLELGDDEVELEIVDSIAPNTVRKVLKKWDDQT